MLISIPVITGIRTFVFSVLIFLDLLRFLLVLLGLFKSLVVEQVNHNVPVFTSVKLSGEVLNLSGEQPEDHGDGFCGFVVAWNSNVDKLEVRVGVSQGNDRNVHVA
jgi:hypothetical protein